MPLLFRRKVKLIVFVLVLFLAPLATANEIGTIKLKSGEEYNGVEFTINRIYKTLQFNYNDQKINVSFSDIELITDPGGQDITSQILESHYRPKKEEWLSKDSKKVVASRGKSWNSILGIGGELSAPAGSYYDGLSAGFGFEGDIRIAINHQFALQFFLSRSSLRVGDDIHLLTDPGITVLDENIGFHVTRYEVALNVYEPFSKRTDPISMWYGFFGLGAVGHKTTLKATLRNDDTGQTAEISDENSESKFAIVFGFGAVKMVSKQFGFDFSGAANLVAIPAESNDPGQSVVYAYILNLKLSAVAVF
jgi:hypothetical protein